ncbi:dipeptide epimerase [Gammaproteobacteria bacterium]|nr:dipeptide epimerase [Gammaproteobacteria bacterium]
MKIKSITAFPISPPARQFYGRPNRTGLGEVLRVDYGLVNIDTDDGHSGVGEICTVFRPGGRSLCEQIDRYLAPVLLGEDPHRISYLISAMDEALSGAEPAKAAIDMALFDIVGKVLQTPVYNLLGGMVRERVPLSHSITYGSSAEMANFAVQLAHEGFTTVKVKVGQGLGKDVDAVREIRKAVGPSVHLRVDANMAWATTKDAIATIRRLEDYDIEIVEQPVPHHALDAMAELRTMTDRPIMADESVWTPMDAMECIRRSAVDVVSVYVAESGGLLKAAQTFSICEAAGIPCLIGSMPETGIGTAAQIHLGVAMTNLRFDSDACGVRYFSEDCLMQPLKIENGYAYPPQGVGLGIDVDKSVLARWRTSAEIEV